MQCLDVEDREKGTEPFYEVFEVYYESIKREPKIRGINKCRCDERLQTTLLLFIINPRSTED
jgi:hypothetical protein